MYRNVENIDKEFLFVNSCFVIFVNTAWEKTIYHFWLQYP